MRSVKLFSTADKDAFPLSSSALRSRIVRERIRFSGGTPRPSQETKRQAGQNVPVKVHGSVYEASAHKGKVRAMAKYTTTIKVPTVNGEERDSKQVSVENHIQVILDVDAGVLAVLDIGRARIAELLVSSIAREVLGSESTLAPLTLDKADFEKVEAWLYAEDIHDGGGRVVRVIFSDATVMGSKLTEINLKGEDLLREDIYKEAKTVARSWDTMTFVSPPIGESRATSTCRLTKNGSLLFYGPAVGRETIDALVDSLVVTLGRRR